MPTAKKNGHNFVPLTGIPYHYNGAFLQMDHRGCQKEICKCCEKIRVSDKRLVELDAPEFQSEYSCDVRWASEGKDKLCGKYSIKIDKENSSYFYVNEDLAGMPRGSIRVCAKIVGGGCAAEEKVLIDSYGFPGDYELYRRLAAYDESGNVLSEGWISCFREVQFYSFTDEEKKKVSDEDYHRGYIFFDYKEGTKEYRPLISVKF